MENFGVENSAEKKRDMFFLVGLYYNDICVANNTLTVSKKAVICCLGVRRKSTVYSNLHVRCREYRNEQKRLAEILMLEDVR